MNGAEWNEAEGLDLSRRQRVVIASAGIVVITVAAASVFLIGLPVPGWDDEKPRVPFASFEATPTPAPAAGAPATRR